MVDDLEQRLAAVAVDVDRQRLGRRLLERRARQADQRRAHGRLQRPPAARARRADRPAPIRIPSERHLGRRPPARSCRRRTSAQVSSTGPKPRPDSRPIPNTRSRSALAPSASSSRRNATSQSNSGNFDLVGRAQLADQLRRVSCVRHARDVGAERRGSSGSRRTAPASPSSAPGRSRTAAVPSAHSPRPPAKRRWLLRAPRASADRRPGVTAEQRDDAIRLAVVHDAQHDRRRGQRGQAPGLCATPVFRG